MKSYDYAQHLYRCKYQNMMVHTECRMTVGELANIFQKFTFEHFAEKEFYDFFEFVNKLSIIGMGIANAGPDADLIEMASISYIHNALQHDYPTQPWTIFDVGANVGQFLHESIKTFGLQNRTYYCFEPSSTAFAALRKSAADRLGIFTYNFGLGDKQGTLPFFASPDSTQLSSVYNRRLEHLNISMAYVHEIPVRTIDAFAEEHAIDRIHFLKLDTEGHELRCIEGAKKLIDAGRIDYIQFEFGCNVDSRTFFRDFWYALDRYIIKRVLKDGPVDIPKYHEREERFLAQHFIACLKK